MSLNLSNNNIRFLGFQITRGRRLTCNETERRAHDNALVTPQLQNKVHIINKGALVGWVVGNGIEFTPIRTRVWNRYTSTWESPS